MNITENKDGVILPIFVKPNSPKFKIEIEENEIIIFSTGEPVKGKVNKEIIKETSKLFGFRVEIVSGATSKQKVLFVYGATKAQVESALKS